LAARSGLSTVRRIITPNLRRQHEGPAQLWKRESTWTRQSTYADPFSLVDEFFPTVGIRAPIGFTLDAPCFTASAPTALLHTDETWE
jgi:hypothetical protein